MEVQFILRGEKRGHRTVRFRKFFARTDRTHCLSERFGRTDPNRRVGRSLVISVSICTIFKISSPVRGWTNAAEATQFWYAWLFFVWTKLMHDDISRNETFFMTTTTLNVTPITENFQTCKPAVLDIPSTTYTRNGTRVLVALYIGLGGEIGSLATCKWIAAESEL